MKTSLKTYLFFFSLLILAASVWLIACKATPEMPNDVKLAYQKLPPKIDFNIDVRPILTDRCYKCHGPDQSKVQGELRLDTPEMAYKALTAGDGNKANHALKANSLEGSEVFHRIISTNPEYMMPTPASNLSLTAYEKAVLIKWIEEGAEYQKHWSLVSVEMPSLPNVKNENLVKNDIDKFILSDLEKIGLTFSKPTSKNYLIRRATFDITFS